MLHIIKQIKGSFISLLENKFNWEWFQVFDGVKDWIKDSRVDAKELHKIATQVYELEWNNEKRSDLIKELNKRINQVSWWAFDNSENSQKYFDWLVKKYSDIFKQITEQKNNVSKNIKYTSRNERRKVSKEIVIDWIMVKWLDKLKWVSLSIGSKWPKVKLLQETLMALGYNVKGGADGSFGKNTLYVLQQFQRKHIWKIYNSFGAATFSKLKKAYESGNWYLNTDHTSARNAEKLVHSTKTKMSNKEWYKRVETLKNSLAKAKVINNALEAYLNKWEVKAILKDSGGDILSIFRSDDFLSYLAKFDGNFVKGTSYYENAKRVLPKMFDKFEAQKTRSSIGEWLFYITFVWVPLFTLNISDQQTIHKSPLTITNAARFYDSLTTWRKFVPVNEKLVEKEYRNLKNASPEVRTEAERAWLKNIDFYERENVSWAMFNWFEKNMPNWFGWDIKADNVERLINEYEKLIKNPTFSISKAKKIISEINWELGKQYKEELNEGNKRPTEKALRKYLNIDITKTYDVGSFEKKGGISLDYNDLVYIAKDKGVWDSFKASYVAPNRANHRVESAKTVLDRANKNFRSIERWRTQLEWKDLSILKAVEARWDKYSTKLAAISEVFYIKEKWINNLLKAHPAVSYKLERKLRSIDFTNPKSIINASRNAELRKYIKAIQNPKRYDKYFIKELSKLKAPRAKDVKRWRFGVPLSKYHGNLSRWAEALYKTWTTWISTLANISKALAKKTGLQVTPRELKYYLANWAIKHRNSNDIITNFADSWNSKTVEAKTLTTKEYVEFTVSKTYEVATKNGSKLIITERVPLSIKTDCANLNLDVANAKYSVVEQGVNWNQEEISLDEALSRVETGKFVVPLFGTSLLGHYLKNKKSPKSDVGSRPGRVNPIEQPISHNPQPIL